MARKQERRAETAHTAYNADNHRIPSGSSVSALHFAVARLCSCAPLYSLSGSGPLQRWSNQHSMVARVCSSALVSIISGAGLSLQRVSSQCQHSAVARICSYAPYRYSPQSLGYLTNVEAASTPLTVARGFSSAPWLFLSLFFSLALGCLTNVEAASNRWSLDFAHMRRGCL
jgi:hypothetical protein